LRGHYRLFAAFRRLKPPLSREGGGPPQFLGEIGHASFVGVAENDREDVTPPEQDDLE
jgi:hypothetical protein